LRERKNDGCARVRTRGTVQKRKRYNTKRIIQRKER
jgi:hypothetical protein